MTWKRITADTPRGIDWVIVGGESGPNARPMRPDWARGIRDQCVSAGVPFFFKQWGEWAEAKNPTHWVGISGQAAPRSLGYGTWASDDGMARVGKKVAGRLLDGREWNEFPEVKA